MEITVGCSCGSKYTFDETPVNGHLCFPVSCPNCGTDGTNQANEYIRKFISGDLQREQQRTKSWWQRLLGFGGAAQADSGPRALRFGMGVAGAVVGAFAGLVAWYFIKRSTGIELGLVAWGIGGLVGLCARLAAGGGSFGLAGVASLAAVVSILGGQYWNIHQLVEDRVPKTATSAYNFIHEYAQRADLAATDEEIIKVLDFYDFRPTDVAPGENPVLCKKRLNMIMIILLGRVIQDGSVKTLQNFMEDNKHHRVDVAAFRRNELPALREFLKGKPSEEEFKASVESQVRKNLSFNKMLTQSWSYYTLLWIFLGVITAYRLAYDRSETEDF